VIGDFHANSMKSDNKELQETAHNQDSSAQRFLHKEHGTDGFTGLISNLDRLSTFLRQKP
jgi:hypothetical protein